MKKILLCVFILLVSVNVFAADVDIEQLTKAAEKGDTEAQYQLGVCYAEGDGVTQNFKEAVKWLTLAAEQKHGYAQADLGFCYTNGYEVLKDFKLAYMWFSISLEYISYDANKEIVKEMLSFLERKMPPAEIAEAKQMAAEWMERHK